MNDIAMQTERIWRAQPLGVPANLVGRQQTRAFAIARRYIDNMSNTRRYRNALNRGGIVAARTLQFSPRTYMGLAST